MKENMMSEMENMMSERENMLSEMENNEVMGTEMDVEVAGETTDKRVFTDVDGNEISMSQFIRDKFNNEDMSRKAISVQFDINYRTVYGATVNMENASEPATRGRGAVNPKIQVTLEGQVYTCTEGVHMLDGEAIEVDASGEIVIPELMEVDRNNWIKELVAEGVNRGHVAKKLNMSYGVVYGLTKEADGTRAKHEVEVTAEDGTVTMMARAEYIRARVAEGISKSDVAKELGVEYATVWQATKKDKTDQDRLVDGIEVLRKLADKMVDPASFEAALDALSTFEVATIVTEEEVVTEA